MAKNLVTRRSFSERHGYQPTSNTQPIPRNTGEINVPQVSAPKWVGNPLVQCKGGISTHNLTTESQVIAPFNQKRTSLFIQNIGVQTVFVSFDGPVGATDNYAGSLKIPPNGFIELKNPVPTNEIYGVAQSGTVLVTVMEGILL